MRGESLGMPTHTRPSSDPVRVLIASYLEPQFVAQIRQQDGIRVAYEADLVPQPRYPCDHVGHPLRRSAEDEARWRGLLADAEVLFDFDYPNLGDLRALIPRVRWIQATSTGIGQLLVRAGLLGHPITFTTARGIHAKPLADFVVMAILWFAKDGFRMVRDQANRRWQRYCGRDVRGETVGIVGFGSIGREVARMSQALGLRVIATKRTLTSGEDPAPADLLLPVDRMDELLGASDFVILAVPHTPQTAGLIGENALGAMKPGAILINVARGAVVDEAALIAALREQRLGGAALDVLASEPPLPDNPLWSMPNVLISPHSASTVASENAHLTALFIDNLGRYIRGDPLRNVFHPDRLY